MKFRTFSLIITFLLFSSVFGNRIVNQFLSSQDYITGDDGEIRMNINIIGHVKYPGTYLVYDGMDIMSALSVSGGYLQGANLKNISIHSLDGSETILNILKIKNNKVDLKPHDTIIVKENLLSQILTSSNLPYVILGILNVALTLENSD